MCKMDPHHHHIHTDPPEDPMTAYDPWNGHQAPLIGASGGGASVNVTINLNLHVHGDADPTRASAFAEILVEEIHQAIEQAPEATSRPPLTSPTPASTRSLFRRKC